MRFFRKFTKKDLLLFASVGVITLVFASSMGQKRQEEKEVALSEFLKIVEKGEVQSVRMDIESLTAVLESEPKQLEPVAFHDEDFVGEVNVVSVKKSYSKDKDTPKNDTKIVTKYPMFYSAKVIDTLIKNNVQVDFIGQEKNGGGKKFAMIFFEILSWLPILLMLYVAFGFTRSVGGGQKSGGMFGSNPFQFVKSKARMVSPKDVKTTFADVAGIDEAKNDVMQIVDFLKHPAKYRKIGAVIPKGCLLVGPPGTGKTLLARAIAGEAKVPFWFISGSDFVEMFVGVGASRVRDVFEQAKKTAPSILFIDEIDAVGRQRGIGIGGGNDEREQTLNQMLVEMDGFEENSGVIVIAATNRSDVLDPALLRPGRFDRQISVGLPDVTGREKILQVHMKKRKVAPSIEIKSIARGTPGFSGAELENLINEAALLAASENQELVTYENIEDAKDKLLLGSVRSTLIKEEEKRLTAYHEGGHALVAYNMAASDPVHKVTIIPRANSLGMVVRLPEGDSFSRSRAKTMADITVAVAGRVAEFLIFGDDKITSGASSDIEMATRYARAMVIEWGMSDKIGMVNCHKITKQSGQSYKPSEDISKTIDAEVRRIIDECYELAKKILTEQRDKLELIAKTLMEFETITGDELKELLTNGKLERFEKVEVVGESAFGKILSTSSKSKAKSSISKSFVPSMYSEEVEDSKNDPGKGTNEDSKTLDVETSKEKIKAKE